MGWTGVWLVHRGNGWTAKSRGDDSAVAVEKQETERRRWDDQAKCTWKIGVWTLDTRQCSMLCEVLMETAAAAGQVTRSVRSR